jgi:hypothetical protein
LAKKFGICGNTARVIQRKCDAATARQNLGMLGLLE